KEGAAAMCRHSSSTSWWTTQVPGVLSVSGATSAMRKVKVWREMSGRCMTALLGVGFEVSCQTLPVAALAPGVAHVLPGGRGFEHGKVFDRILRVVGADSAVDDGGDAHFDGVADGTMVDGADFTHAQDVFEVHGWFSV